jgi:putative hydroxymethylpyrimidine transporter CytX
MIIGGAKAFGAIANPALNINSQLPWCILIGGLIVIWVAAGLKNLNKLNNVAVVALFFLTILLSTVVFKSGNASQVSGSITYGMAVELSAAMPLSWLPLISDYTKNADNPKKLTLFSTLFYFIGSCWMYIIGLGAAIFTGDSDIAKILMAAGFSVVAMIIVALSTVTTTFLDVYSAAISAMNIHKKINEKWLAIGVCVLGTIIAIFTPIEQYENFLYLIGSVFAPMIAILITDYFILNKSNAEAKYNITNFILWIFGFISYRIFLSADTFIGSTLPVMIVISVVCIVVNSSKKIITGK